MKFASNWEREQDALNSMFKAIDNSGENKITNYELMDYINSRGKLKGEDKKKMIQIVTKAFRRFDVDNSG